MLRYPAIFLVGVFFTLGPAPFERLHIAEANRSWHLPAQVADSTSASPLKRLPVRPPVHDASTCIICAMLHAPMTAQQAPPVSLALMARVGYLPVESSHQFHFIFASCEHCRGPPAV